MTIESPVLVFNPHAPLVQAAKLQGAEVHVPDSVIDSSRPTYSPTQTIDTFTQRLFQRMPPLALT